MRGDANSPTRRDTQLNIPAQRALYAALAALIVVTVSGGATSPLLLLLAAALVFVLRYVEHPAVLAAPILAAAVLLAVSHFGGGITPRSAFISVALVLAALPGLAWRREQRRTQSRLAQLDHILTEAEADRKLKAAAPSAAEELADLERALASVAARVQARSVVLWDVDAFHGTARARAASNGRPPTVLRLAGDPIGWAWEHGMRLRLEQPPRWAEPGTYMVAERLRRHEDYGMMVTYAFDPARVPADDMPFEETAIYLRGIVALYDARAFTASSERRVNTLLDRLREIPDQLDPDAYITGLCRTAIAMTEGTGAAIGVWDGEQGRVIAVAGEDGGPRAGDDFRAPESELGLSMRAGGMIVRDAGSWTLGRTCVAHANERWLARPRALAALPLRGPTGTTGVLAVWSSQARALDQQALDLLVLLAPHAALHLEQAYEFHRMRESAERDALTLLRNRGAFERVFALESSRCERYGRPLSLLMLDLDHFKNVNDRFGHEAGDEVLRQVARVLSACVRDVDTAARFGGEEFVVLMPETALAPALDVAHRIRAAVENLSIRWQDTPIPISVSIGASAVPERVAHPSDLIRSADAALYRSKAAGRNRVTAAERG